MRTTAAILWAALAVATLACAPAAAQAVVTFQPSPHTRLCFLDDDGSGSRAPAEPLYLSIGACGGGTAAGDVRLTTSAAFSGGTIVRGTEDDAGRPGANAAPASYAFFDAGGDGSYSPGDDLYLHFGGLPGTVGATDIPFTGPAAFQPIAPEDNRIGRPLGATGLAIGNESFAEIDGNSGYTTGDRVYLDFDGDGRPTPGDLRLASEQASTANATSSSDSSSSTPPHHPFDPTVDPGTGEPGGNVSEPENGPSNDAPASLAIVLLALVLAARRLV